MGTAAISFGPKLGLLNNATIGEQYYDQFRPFLRGMDALIQPTSIDWQITDPPSSPADGDTYVLATSGFTGAWNDRDNQIAVWSTQRTDSGGNTLDPGWDFYTPSAGWFIWTASLDMFILFNGTSWVDSTTGIPYTIFASNSPIYVNAAQSFGEFLLEYPSGSITLAASSASGGGQVAIASGAGLKLASGSGSGSVVNIDGDSISLVGSISLNGQTNITPTQGLPNPLLGVVYPANCSGSSIAQALPAIDDVPGVILTFKKIDSSVNTLTLTPTNNPSGPSTTIEGNSSYVISSQWGYVTLYAAALEDPGSGVFTPTWLILASG